MSIIIDALKKVYREKKRFTVREHPHHRRNWIEEVTEGLTDQQAAVEELRRRYHEDRPRSHVSSRSLLHVIWQHKLLLFCLGFLIFCCVMYSVRYMPLEPELVCTGIIYDPAAPSCIINGRIVGIGEEVDGARVLHVTLREVLVEYGGRQYNLPLQ